MILLQSGTSRSTSLTQGALLCGQQLFLGHHIPGTWHLGALKLNKEEGRQVLGAGGLPLVPKFLPRTPWIPHQDTGYPSTKQGTARGLCGSWMRGSEGSRAQGELPWLHCPQLIYSMGISIHSDSPSIFLSALCPRLADQTEGRSSRQPTPPDSSSMAEALSDARPLLLFEW